jgi:pyruvate dehydrogenase E2 component (dihydrolipoamide acetyltransferase)
MSFDFLLPDIGEGIAEAEIAEWLVSPGDTVIADQLVVLVETDKMSVEIPTPTPGTVKELGGEVGETVPVGSTLMLIEIESEEPAGEAAFPKLSADDAPPEASGEAPAVQIGANEVPIPPTGGRPKASPAVRRLARDRSIDLAQVVGSGPGGRILRGDLDSVGLSGELVAATGGVSNASAPATRSPRETERIPFRGLRRKIAENVQRSWQQIPMAIDFRQADGSRLLELRAELKASAPEGTPISYDAIMTRILASALRKHPMLNSSLDEESEEIVLHGSINVGVAMAANRGVIVPVVHDADRLTIFEIAETLEDLTQKSKSNRLEPTDLRGGTVTLNNTGALAPTGGLHMLPLINHPQAAILAFGRVHDCVFAVDGQPVVRPGLYLTCNSDHRLVDGEGLVAFMNDVFGLVENPFRLIGELR